MDPAYFVDVDGCQFVVKYARLGEAPVVVGGPFWTATAAWQDAQRRAAEGEAASFGDRPTRDDVLLNR